MCSRLRASLLITKPAFFMILLDLFLPPRAYGLEVRLGLGWMESWRKGVYPRQPAGSRFPSLTLVCAGLDLPQIPYSFVLDLFFVLLNGRLIAHSGVLSVVGSRIPLVNFIAYF